MPHKAPTLPPERANHRIDIVRSRKEYHGGGALGHLTSDFIEQRASEVRTRSLLCDAPGQPACNEPGGDPGRTEQRADGGPAHSTLSSAPDELLLVVGIHVVTSDGSSDHDPIAAVMLGKRDLSGPRDALGRHARVRSLGTLGVLEHHQCKIETRRLHLGSNGTRLWRYGVIRTG